MNLDDVKQGLSSAWESVADGWRRLRDSAASSLTGFKPTSKNELPQKQQVDDEGYFPTMGWALLAGNVFEDGQRVVVKLEIPGLEKDDFKIDLSGDTLTVSGEKRFQREKGDGRYRSFQCAYGSFQRNVRLPAPVQADAARATYRNGILSIELPKAQSAAPKAIDVKIN